jgi:hypothetical protein
MRSLPDISLPRTVKRDFVRPMIQVSVRRRQMRLIIAKPRPVTRDPNALEAIIRAR